MDDKFTDKEVQKLGLYERHWNCGGGEIEQIGTVIIGYGPVPEWRCKKCGVIYDASDYDQHAGYWAKKYSKDAYMELLPEVFSSKATP